MTDQAMLTEQQVLQCLKEAMDVGLFNKLSEQSLLSISLQPVTIQLTLPFYAPSWLQQIQDKVTASLALLTEQPVAWQVNIKVPSFEHKQIGSINPNVKNIIAVSSGKGGVGKSTVSVNLALALSTNGARVGMLDADIYGPSLPLMLGERNTKAVSADGKFLQPIHAHGIFCNSIGFLVDEDNAMVWRGPMASKALQQVLNETDWPELDYLIVDMPPGTGDIQLTMSQSVQLTSALVVSTPQDIALIDAKKGIAMFKQVDVNVVGIVENMSLYSCVKCGHQEPIFGTGGGKKLAEQFNLPYLGDLPLHAQYRLDTDQGEPTVAKAEPQALVEPYLALAEQLAINLFSELNPVIEQIKITEVQ